MDWLKLVNRGVSLHAPPSLTKEEKAVKTTVDQWKREISHLQLFMWSNPLDPLFADKSLRLSTVLTLVNLAIVHRDHSHEGPSVSTLRGALSALQELKPSSSEDQRLMLSRAISSAAELALSEIDRLPTQSVIHSCMYLRKVSNGSYKP